MFELFRVHSKAYFADDRHGKVVFDAQIPSAQQQEQGGQTDGVGSGHETEELKRDPRGLGLAFASEFPLPKDRNIQNYANHADGV